MADEKRRSSLYLDLKELRERFEEVDQDNKGYIDYGGLEQMIAGMEGFDSSMTGELMDSLDRDKDGKVTFDDFQTLFTLKRDTLKEEQSNNNSNVSSPHSSAYITAMDASAYSPEKPPVPPGSSSRSYKKQTSPSPNIFTHVPGSPDLASHVRSLRGTVFELSAQDPKRLSLGSEQGDIVLEDTGGGDIEETYPASFASPKTHSWASSYDFIRKELESICPTNEVEKEHIIKLCTKLQLDAQDEQDLIGTWEELDNATIDDICHSLKQKELTAMVTSTPASLFQSTSEAWKEPPGLGTPIIPSFLKDPPKPIKKSTEDVEEVEDSIEEDDSEDHEDGWNNTSDFSFQEISRVRPSSASKEGMRLSRGYSESSLRQSVVFHNEYKSMQEKLHEMTQENDSLKTNLSRVEEERRKLIHEGEESIQLLQLKKENEIRKVQEEYSSKIKELEKSFTDERQAIQDRADQDIINLNEQLKLLKNDNESLREDGKYYHSEYTKLVEEREKLCSQIEEKDRRIDMLHRFFGVQTEAATEADLERQASRIQSLESDLQDYTVQNENLKEQNKELADRVDELKAECEQLKQKAVSEKRRRQRHRPGTSSPTIVAPSHGKRKDSLDHKMRTHRLLPSLASLATPVNTRKLSVGANAEGVEEDVEVTEDIDTGNIIDVVPGEEEFFENESSDEIDEDVNAVSSASLLEEMKFEDHKQILGKKISEMEIQRSKLEASCNDLTMQLQTLEESKITMREKLEEELRKKMYQRANLDKRLSELHKIREQLAKTRRTVTDNLQASEDILTQYLAGFESDFNQLITEDTSEEMANTARVQELQNEIEQLISNLHINESINNQQQKEIQDLLEKNTKQETMINQLQSQLLMSVNNNGQLEKSIEEYSSKIQHLEGRIEAQERELKMKKTESGLANYDLVKKQEECSALQEKVQKLEKEVICLHADKDDLCTRYSKLKTQLDSTLKEKSQTEESYQEAMKEATNIRQQLTNALNETNSLKDQIFSLSSPPARSSSESSSPMKAQVTSPAAIEESFLFSSPLPLFSPNCSFNSNISQFEIVSQMKTQLEDLQSILIKKGNEDVNDTELSVIQELLDINTTLEENIMKQQRWYNSEMAIRDAMIQQLQKDGSHLSESNVIDIFNRSVLLSAEGLQDAPELIQAMSNRISSLSTAVSNIQMKLADRDLRQSSALNNVMTELNSTRVSVDTYQHEVDLLSTGLEKSRHSLNQSKDEMIALETSKDDEIEALRDDLSQLKGELEESKKSFDALQASLEQKEIDYHEKEKQTKQYKEIIQRQKSELELLNHYLGKAKSLELKYDQEKVEKEKELQEKEQDILSKSMKIHELQEKMKKFNSLPDLFDTSRDDKDETTGIHVRSAEELDLQELNEDIDALYNGCQESGIDLVRELRGEIERIKEGHELEMLTEKESLQAAEDMIIRMQNELHSLYLCIVNPSDSTPSDLLEFSDVVIHIREAFNNLMAELLSEKALREEIEESMAKKTEDYDQLYTEHDEEVQALSQQKDQIQSRLSEVEEHFEHLFVNQERQIIEFQKEKKALLETNRKLEETLVQTEAEAKNSFLMFEQQKSTLIEVIHRLSLQTVQTLNTIIQ